jgi:uncharacterized protein (DUF302 family)
MRVIMLDERPEANSSGAGGVGGIVTKLSPRSVTDTVDRLTAVVAARGMKVFAVIDHSGEASAVGLDVPPETRITPVT